jgi:hypothetical protein
MIIGTTFLGGCCIGGLIRLILARRSSSSCVGMWMRVAGHVVSAIGVAFAV